MLEVRRIGADAKALRRALRRIEELLDEQQGVAVAMAGSPSKSITTLPVTAITRMRR